ncbi:hypothetical protein KDD17_03950 [Sulfitobacter albidus]|uniref:Uncharacterized protein n=1 Tax=Sulfitobacter albidus TaxID=2829501 RepID=A0A975JF96_9RHOB|nr:hypothetical protein [Sulfitobacter albidus]QUJ77185.1 hypothetical protein KDD17_03950 [Sulfitobacter albidus]
MDWTLLTAALVFTTLILAVGFAYWNKNKVEERMDDPHAPKSTLAKDGDPHGTPADVK